MKLSRNGHTCNVCLLQWRKTTTVLPQKSKQKIEDSCFIVCEWNFRELLPFLSHSWTLLSSSQHLLLHSRNLSRALIYILLWNVCFCFLLCFATLYNFNHVSAVWWLSAEHTLHQHIWCATCPTSTDRLFHVLYRQPLQSLLQTITFTTISSTIFKNTV